MVIVAYVLEAVPLAAMHPHYEGPPDGRVSVRGRAELQERVRTFDVAHSWKIPIIIVTFTV